ncbi:sugar-binding domain-containing protein [Mucilaginibacter sp. L196]|uniref:sugar-binding domain-containing protein n=1 Tax=Mucilaginibacter sp. L196 TaxID=1641870 RepID=UPI00131DCD09|nr:sugar-binding domain-containing protein [Mucilaginibacter sp. L196]
MMLKNSLIYFGLCLLLSLCNIENLTAQSRTNIILFNDNWKFHKGDIRDASDVRFFDDNWDNINLPHDWSIRGPFSKQWASATAYLPGGIGWYRKSFTVPAGYKSKQVYIYFDGIYKNSSVWINGHLLGFRPNGFISFQYDLTPYLKIGQRNLIAVKVDHSQFADSRWYTGSGIYRNVYLITSDPLHIGQWGIQFTTPKVSAEQAEANIAVSVINNNNINKHVTVHCSLINGKGETVSQVHANLLVNKKDTAVSKMTLTVKDPQLWSVEHPQLYHLVVSLAVNGKQTDELREQVGIRSIRFDPDNGFFLNGQSMKLKGVCLHDDAGALGVAVPEAVWYRRLKILKAAGCNALRMSHNPHAGYLYDLCDELGILVMDEAFDEWEFGKNKWIQGYNVGAPGTDGYHQYFKEWADKDLKDMVRRDRNHPSIVMWSIGNEIDYPNDPYTDTVLNAGSNPQIYKRGYLKDHPPASRLGELSRQLVLVLKQYDVSRPVTAALAGVVMSNKTTYPGNLDIVGYNYQEYRYSADHQKYPKRVIYGSENGMSLEAWKAVDTNKYIAGQFLWTGVDYMGEANSWPARSNGQGLIDLAGFPKPMYYFRQSLWSEKPMVFLSTSKIPNSTQKSKQAYLFESLPAWNYSAGDSVRIYCFTNCKEGELFLNGHSLGKKQLSQFADRVIYWDVVYQPGTLMVKAYVGGGNEINYTLKTAGVPYGLIVDTDVTPDKLQHDPLQIVIKVVDKNGVLVSNADNLIKIKIQENGRLLGLESGSLTSHEDYQADNRKALNGKLLAYIKVVDEHRPIQLVFQSSGLKSKKIRINASGIVK